MSRQSALQCFIVLSGVFFITHCANVDSNDSSGLPSIPGSSGVNAIRVAISTTYETDASKSFPTTHGICTMSADAVGTASNCTVQIPENQLYFSNLHFEVTADPGYCEFATFHPYYFRISTAPSFIQPDATVIVCSGVSTAAGCYFGAMLDLYPDPSQAVSTYFLPSVSAKQTFDFSAGNQKRMSNTNYDYYLGSYCTDPTDPTCEIKKAGRNVWTVNDLIDTDTAQTIAGGGKMDYAGNEQWQDWGVTCRDKYHELKYDLTIYLEDIDSDENHFTTWQ